MAMRSLVLSIAVALTAATVHGGDLKMRFQYEGDAPTPQPIHVRPGLGLPALVEQRLLVNPQNNGIKNVVVYVYTGRGGSVLPKSQPNHATRTLATRNFQYEPRILTAQVGDTLRITNRDPVGHNPNLNFLKNAARNVVIPAGAETSVELRHHEPAPIPVECNVHPWAKAYVVVLDHPYVAVSDEDGKLLIKDLPEGEPLTFRVFHEAARGSLEHAVVNGTVQAWQRNRFTVSIAPGVHDYGTVTLTSDQLR